MRRALLPSTLISLALLAVACGVPAPEVIDQERLTEDRTLVNRIDDPEAIDYLVVQAIGIGSTLTIEPGVRIAFKRDSGMWIGSATGDGALIAIGTAESPIIFEGEEEGPGSWLGLGVGSPSPRNRLEQVKILEGGQAPVNGILSERAGLTLWDGQLDLVDTEVRDSASLGFVVATSPGAAPGIGTFARNTFTANADAPVRISSNLLGILDGASHFTGNGKDEAVVYTGDFAPPLDHAATVEALDVPYRIEGPLGLSQDLTLSAGVTFRMASDAQIVVGNAVGEGSLAIEGTAAAPVRILGANETPGSWGGIFVGSGSSRNVFTGVEIAHGGGITPILGEPANIVLGDRGGVGTSLRLVDSNVHSSSGWGVFVNTDATFTESGDTYASNARGSVGP